MNDLALLLGLFGNSEETNFIDMHGNFLSGVYSISEMEGWTWQKSANIVIVTDALILDAYTM